jgi:hypothetical protein
MANPQAALDGLSGDTGGGRAPEWKVKRRPSCHALTATPFRGRRTYDAISLTEAEVFYGPVSVACCKTLKCAHPSPGPAHDLGS